MVIGFAGARSSPDAAELSSRRITHHGGAAGVPAQVDRTRGRSGVVRPLPAPDHARPHSRDDAIAASARYQPAAGAAAAHSRSPVEAVSATTGTLFKGDIVEVRSTAIIATLDERASWTRCRSCPRWLPCADVASRWRLAPNASATRSLRAVRARWSTQSCSKARAVTARATVVAPPCVSCTGRRGCATSIKARPTTVPAPRLAHWPPTKRRATRSSRSLRATRKSGGDNGEPVRFRCQATQANEASTPIRSRIHGRMFGPTRPATSPLAVSCRHRDGAHGGDGVGQATSSRVRGPLRGATSKSGRTPTLDLRAPGEWVRIKTAEEIQATLNDKGKNRGLWFDREMMRLCGQVFRVSHRVDRLIDERTGEMIELSSDCVALEGARARVSTAWDAGSVHAPSIPTGGKAGSRTRRIRSDGCAPDGQGDTRTDARLTQETPHMAFRILAVVFMLLTTALLVASLVTSPPWNNETSAASSTSPTTAQGDSLPVLPAGWPEGLELGIGDSPGAARRWAPRSGSGTSTCPAG